MREFDRIGRITYKLDLLWSQPQYADMRLGQLIVNLTGGLRVDDGYIDTDPWHVEDDVWERAIDAALARLVVPHAPHLAPRATPDLNPIDHLGFEV